MSILDSLTCETADLGQENVKKLLALFPECACESGQVDFDKLKQVLSSEVLEGDVERYQFTWPGKRKAMAAANAKTTKTLRPCRDESVNFDTTENLYIEGDNLEALKLLQAGYAGKVKMIYIDPPYNTGKDFVYRDRFSLTDKEVADAAGAFDAEGNRYEKNDSAEARYHTNWCNMMYPRLELAKTLLHEEGFIFVSIGDEEFSNMRKLLDLIFGEANYRNVIATRRYDKNLNRQFMDNGLPTLNVGYEFIFVYSKSQKGKLNPVFRSASEERREGGYWKGFWNAADRPTMRYEIFGIKPDVGQWKWQESLAREAIKNYEVYKQDHSTTMTLEEYWEATGCIKRFLRREKDGKGKNRGVEHWVAPTDKILRTTNWTDMLASKPCGLPFDSPKNPNVILELARLASLSKEDIAIDFFSGSATTAHTVMQLNAEDNGKRKFILVQLPEDLDDSLAKASSSEKETIQKAIAFLDSLGCAHKLTELGKERIRRAGKEIKDENPLITKDLDVGFRVLKIDSSSINDVAVRVDEQTQEFNFETDRIKTDRSSEDLLFQVLLQTQLPLSESITRETICGNEVFTVGGVMMACLDAQAKLTEEFFTALAQRKPDFAFFRDDSFADDNARINLVQIFKQFSKDTKIKVL